LKLILFFVFGASKSFRRMGFVMFSFNFHKRERVGREILKTMDRKSLYLLFTRKNCFGAAFTLLFAVCCAVSERGLKTESETPTTL
jgi:hypothetical protein